MKKFLLIIVSMFFSMFLSAQAQTIKVTALENFSTLNPSTTFSIRTIESKNVSQDIFLPAGTVVSGIIVRVQEPKIGKRNSSFEFLPTYICYNGKNLVINNSKIKAVIIGYEPVEPKDVAFNIARKTANFIFKGVISAVEFIQGACQAESGNRIKSGAMNAYKDSFFSYIEVGSELNINKNDTLFLKIKKIH